MDCLTLMLYIFLLLLLWILLDKFYSKFHLLPPGPLNLPLLGVLPIVGRKPYVKLSEWARKYGPIIHVKIGMKSVIVLNTFQPVVEAFVRKGKIFNHRNPVSLLRFEMKGLGLLNNEGDSWTVHRRFTTQCLKNIGFERTALEEHILDETTKTIEEMRKNKGRPFDPKYLLTLTIANIIWSSIAGQRFERNDPKLIQLANMNDDIIKSIGTLGLLSYYPQLRFILYKKYSVFKIAMNNLKNYIQNQIELHRQTPNEEATDLISEYLNAAEKAKKIDQTTTFNDEQICAVLLDLFVAGLETTVTVIRWCILLAVKHSDVQYKLAREIDNTIGHFRLATNEDRLRMPYIEAFISEVLRFSSVIHMVHHCTAQDTHLMGYFIPAKTPVLANIWSINRDTNVWHDPYSFNVDRFLDEQGKYKKIDSFIPFGIGKRACPAEGIARIEIFLILTSLFQKFTIKSVEGEQLNLEPNSGLVLSPLQFEIVVESRRSLSES